jgi:hypothetical protein
MVEEKAQPSGCAFFCSDDPEIVWDFDLARRGQMQKWGVFAALGEEAEASALWLRNG